MNTSHHLTIKIETKEKRVADELVRIISSLQGFQIHDPGTPGPCDLLILEIGNDADREFQRVHAILASRSAKEVFLTSTSADQQILIKAMRAGVREFFPQPLNEEEVINAMAKLKGSRSVEKSVEVPAKKGKIINVLGAKGGTGTTTVAVNLATGLASEAAGQSVALIDMNLIVGEVPLFLNIKPVFDWLEVAHNIARLDRTYLMSILLKHSSGVHVLPSPSKAMENSAPPAGVMQHLLKLMQEIFDFVVIDSGQAIDEISKIILKAADVNCIVAVPGLPCIVNSKRLLGAFRDLGYPREQNIEVIMNRFDQKSSITVAEAEKSLGKKIRWLVPNDYRCTMSAINSGEPLAVAATGTSVHRRIAAIALDLAGKTEHRKEKKRLFGLMQ